MIERYTEVLEMYDMEVYGVQYALNQSNYGCNFG